MDKNLEKKLTIRLPKSLNWKHAKTNRPKKAIIIFNPLRIRLNPTPVAKLNPNAWKTNA